MPGVEQKEPALCVYVLFFSAELSIIFLSGLINKEKRRAPAFNTALFEFIFSISLSSLKGQIPPPRLLPVDSRLTFNPVSKEDFEKPGPFLGSTGTPKR